MTQIQVVLEFWREAERVLEELDAQRGCAGTTALVSQIEELRVLYQRVLDQHLHDVQASPRTPGPMSDSSPVDVAIETARQRLQETVRRFRSGVDEVLAGDTRLAR